MNNNFSLQQISRTGNLDSYLISRQYKINLMADFMRVNYENPKLKQSEMANQLSYSSSTLQRYRNCKNMLSPYRIQSKKRKKAFNTNFNNISHREPDVERLRMTSNDLKTTQQHTESNRENKINLKAGSVHEIVEINDQNLDEILDNNDL